MGACSRELPQPKFFPANDNRIFAVELAFLDKARRVKRFRQAGQRVAAELLIFIGNRRHERQILRGNDLVGVDVVAHHVNRPGKNRLHGANVPCASGFFNQISAVAMVPAGGIVRAGE